MYRVGSLGVFIIALFACAPYLAPLEDVDATVYVLNAINTPGADAHALLVDGASISSLHPRQYTWFRLPPGNYTFTVMGANDTSTQSALELSLAPGGTRYLVYDEDSRFDYLIEYAEGHARRWLTGARYVRNSIEH